MSKQSKGNVEFVNEGTFKMPQGTVHFPLLTKNISFLGQEAYIIFEFFTGIHIFILEIKNNFSISFIHSSASSGSRHVEISIKEILSADEIFIYCGWSNKEVTLSVFSKDPKSPLLTNSSQNAEFEYRIFENKIIFFKSAFEMMNFRMKSKYSILEPFAFELWRNIKEALIILRDNSKNENSLFELIQSNLAIVAMVTGFENYSKQRFVELYEEGVKINLQLLLSKMVSQTEREKLKILQSNEDVTESWLFYEIIKSINFQNFKKCNDAFKYGYEINFYQSNFLKIDIEKIKNLILFRHKIIHISPIVDFSYENDILPEEILTHNENLKNSLIIFDEFITTLHNETLQFGR